MTLKRRITVIVGLLTLVYLGVLVYFSWMQGPLIFQAKGELENTKEQVQNKINEVEKEGKCEVENISIPIFDSNKNRIGQLNAFWVKHENPDSPVVLHLHGNEATRAKHPEHIRQLRECKCHVLSIDYRGFAESYDSETPSEASVYEDALTALNYLKDELKFPPNKIFIHGHSLGGAIAIDLAARDESADLAGLIVESSFTSMLEMSKLKYGGTLQLLPIDVLLTERFESRDKIKRVKIPVLFIHGECDDKVPHTMTDELFDAACEPKYLCKIEQANHDNCGSCKDPKYHEELEKFILSCLNDANDATNETSP